MDNETKILVLLETLVSDVGALKTGQERLELRMEGLEQRLGSVEQRLEGLEQRLGSVEQCLDGVEQRFGSVEQRLDGAEQRQETIQRKLDRLHESVIRIENEYGYKISILFDAYQANKDSYMTSNQRISVLEEGFEKLSLEVMALKTKI